MASAAATTDMTGATDTSVSESDTCVGQVKWFDKVKGFGFISNLDDQTDYFVHHTQIKTSLNDDSQRELFRYLIAGEYVEFQLQQVTEGHAGNRVMACRVTGIRGGDLMYHIIHQQHQERHAFHRDKYGDDDLETTNTNTNTNTHSRTSDSPLMDVDDDGFTQVRRKQRR